MIGQALSVSAVGRSIAGALLFCTLAFCYSCVSSAQQVEEPTCKDRPCVAVVKFSSVQPCEYFAGRWGNVFGCTSGWEAFREILEVQLAKSRKMLMVERGELEQVFAEQDLQFFIRTGSPERLRNTSKKVTYLVFGKITELGYEQDSYRDARMSISSLRGTFAVDVKLVEVRTGLIKRATSIRVTSSLGSDTSTGSGGVSDSRSLGSLYAVLQRDAAEQIAADMLVQVFPLRVIKVAGRNVYLNHGDSVLKVGDQVEVLGAGEDLTDPDTGKKLGSSSIPVGKIRISRVTPDFSISEITECTPSDFQSGQIGNLVGAPSAQENTRTFPKVDLP